MADNESYSDDISALWGDTAQDAFEPPRPNGAVTHNRGPSPAPAPADPRDTVAGLANALAGHLVVAHDADADQRSRDAADALSELLRNSEMRDAAATESLEQITERMASVQNDLNEVHEAVHTLREEVSNFRKRPGAWRRWGRWAQKRSTSRRFAPG